MAGEPKMEAKCGAEFLGTFLLVLTVGCNVLSMNGIWGGVSIASVLMVSIYALGGISGANFNPAVSLALGASKAMGGPGLDWKTVGTYSVAQVVAGMMAGVCYTALFWKKFNLEPAQGFGAVQAGVCEVVYTFMLCFVVLNVAAAKKVLPNEYYGLAIGFVIVAGAYGAGAVSGGCFNPAVAIGVDVASFSLGFGWCIFYALCEAVGALLAAGLFRVVRPSEFGAEAGDGTAAAATSEFLGTYMLVLTVGLNVLGRSAAGAYSIAASLMCMIYALGDVSGAHFNPAVTLAIFCSGRCSEDLTLGKALGYVVAQLLGASLAGLTYTTIYRGAAFPLAPGHGFGVGEAALAEIIFTFVLCYVVLSVAVSSTTADKTMFGLAIGACVTVGGNAIGRISGGSLNPAVSWGIACAYGMSNIGMAGLYSLFECLGAVVAAGAFAATHAVDLSSEKSAAQEA